MKAESHDGARERAVLRAMITDESVLARLAAVHSADLFYSRWSNLVGTWAVKYFRRYGRAPGAAITPIYERWCRRGRDAETAQLVGDFLSSISGEYERLGNSDFDLDRAAEYLNEVRLRRLSEQISDRVAGGDVTGAMELACSYAKVEVGLGSVFDPFADEAAASAAFSESGESLISFSGDLEALGDFFLTSLSRDSLVALLAPEGVGKSMCLLDLSYMAMLQGRKVLYFEAGDNSQNQVMRRLMCRSAQHPWKAKELRFPCSIRTGDSQAVVGFRPVGYQSPLTLSGARSALDQDRELASQSGGGMRMSCHATGTLSVEAVEGVIDQHSRGGYDVDICIAEGELVLTDRGLVPIEKVACSDRLWDGINWVCHSGLVYKGVRDVITHAGLTATPDHRVWTRQGWRTLVACARMGLGIAQTGSGREEIRVGRSYVASGEGPQRQVSEAGIRLCPLCAVPTREMVSPGQFVQGNSQRMPQMPAADKVPALVVGKDVVGSAEVLQSEQFCLEEVWREGDRVPILVGSGSRYLGPRQSGPGFRERDRPHRQQRPLRARELATIHPRAELLAYQQASAGSTGAQIQDHLSRHRLLHSDSEVFVSARPEPCPNCGAVAQEQAPVKAPVWDIANAGPLHRFTVQGLLVSNCVIDYADIMLHPSGRKDVIHQIEALWQQLRSLSQKRHCLVLTATQATRDAYRGFLLAKQHVSGNKLKLANVNAMIGINQSEADKEQQLYRLNVIKMRADEFSASKTVWVAGCPGVYSPFQIASW